MLVIDKTAGLSTSQERYVQLARFKDIELHVLAPRKWKEHGLLVDATQLPPPEGYTLHLGRTIWKGYYARGYYVTGLWRTLLRSKPDIIHLLEEPWSFFACQTIRSAKVLARQSRFIFYSWENIYRGKKFNSRISFLQRRIDRRTMKRSDAAMCATEAARTCLELKGFKGRIEVVPYGVDTPFLEENVEPALPREPGKFRIGFIGRFMKMKGLNNLIESASRIDNSQLLLIGQGDWEEEMRRLIDRKGMNERCTLLSPVERQQVPSYLASVDCLVLPSRTTDEWMEQLGRVLIEAMAMGVPVIGSDSGSIPEVIGDAGIIFPEDEPYTLARCLVNVRDNPELRRQMIQAGKQRIRERYNWPLFAKQTYQLYQEVMSL